MPLEQVAGGLDVALGRAEVQPVAVGVVGVDAVADELREDVVFERAVLAGRDHLEHIALEHVGAGVDARVGRRVLGFGLLEERLDAVLVVGQDDAVGGRVLDRNQRERGAGAGGARAGRSRRRGRSRRACRR